MNSYDRRLVHQAFSLTIRIIATQSEEGTARLKAHHPGASPRLERAI